MEIASGWLYGCYDAAVSDATSKLTVAGIVIGALLAIAGCGLAMTGYVNPDLGWVLVTLGLGAAAWVIVRTWLPDMLPFPPLRRTARTTAPDAAAQPDPSPLTPIEEILEDLRTKYGPDHARTIVGDAAVARKKPDSRSSQGTSAAPHVVQHSIRRDPEHATRWLEILETVQFEELVQKADSRSAEQRTEAFQVFGRAALKLLSKLDQCKTQVGMQDRDWLAIEALNRQTDEALHRLSPEKYCQYAKYLSDIRNVVARRGPLNEGQLPFTLRDLRDCLARDGVA